MAQYGPPYATTGRIPFTGWTPTMGTGAANAGSDSGQIYNNGFTQQDGRLAHYLRVPGSRALRRLMRTLMGVAPGASASESRTRVQARLGAPGGLQVIETVPYVNRNTTAADVTQITALLDRTTYPASYPVDLSGNGGGGKLAYKGI